MSIHYYDLWASPSLSLFILLFCDNNIQTSCSWECWIPFHNSSRHPIVVSLDLCFSLFRMQHYSEWILVRMVDNLQRNGKTNKHLFGHRTAHNTHRCVAHNGRHAERQSCENLTKYNFIETIELHRSLSGFIILRQFFTLDSIVSTSVRRRFADHRNRIGKTSAVMINRDSTASAIINHFQSRILNETFSCRRFTNFFHVYEWMSAAPKMWRRVLCFDALPNAKCQKL